MALVKERFRAGSLDGITLSAMRWALDRRLYWWFCGEVLPTSLSSWVMICGWWRLGCCSIPGDIMVGVCGEAILVDGCMVSGTSVALAANLVCVGAGCNFWSVSMAFSLFVASVTFCLGMTSYNCLMAEMRQLVADTVGTGVWCWFKMVLVILFVLVCCMIIL